MTGLAGGENTGLRADSVLASCLDSAIVPHFDDTRGDGSGQWPSGVASGFINFQVDDDGQPVAFQFSPPLSSGFTSLPIAIGRLA